MITEKNHKLLKAHIFVADCTKKGLASMHTSMPMRHGLLFQWASTKNPTLHVGLEQSRPHHHLIEN